MPPKELLDVIRQVHNGKKRIPAELAAQLAQHVGEESLTRRELDVLAHIAGGNRNRDIAERLFISGRGDREGSHQTHYEEAWRQ